MFIHESIRCKALTASPKGLEQRNTKSYSCDRFYAKLNESRQDAWVSTKFNLSYSRASKQGALGSFEAEMGYGIL
jgi:hypothetical protein